MKCYGGGQKDEGGGLKIQEREAERERAGSLRRQEGGTSEPERAKAGIRDPLLWAGWGRRAGTPLRVVCDKQWTAFLRELSTAPEQERLTAYRKGESDVFGSHTKASGCHLPQSFQSL